MTGKTLLEVKNLKTYFYVEGIDNKKPELIVDKKLKGKIAAKAVEDVSFNVYEGEVLGIVGESGSGKSVTANSILRLVPDPPGKIVGGEILYKGIDLLKLDFDEMRDFRGKEIAMIFQEPLTSLNPVMRIGDQIKEIILRHNKISKDEANLKAIEMLEHVGIPDAAKRMKDYPHQYSGGMRQRVMIAIALACNPSLLIADEPTTALDVTIQAQILDLMIRLKNEREGAAILLITHNLGVVAETCDRVIVMYGGRIQEIGSADVIFNNPLHPYTKGLLNSLPDPYKQSHEKLKAIPGNVPHILDLPTGCKFCTRCLEKKAEWYCEKEPELLEVEQGHFVRCHLYQ
jgi:oligopeptide/dipeptide ABC transporter ATP-binding protein